MSLPEISYPFHCEDSLTERVTGCPGMYRNSVSGGCQKLRELLEVELVFTFKERDAPVWEFELEFRSC